MILPVSGFSAAETRNCSMIVTNSGDRFWYFDLQLDQFVPWGALLAWSTKSMSSSRVGRSESSGS